MAENKQNNKDRAKSDVPFCSVFFLLSLACIVFGVLLLAEWNGRGVAYVPIWISLFTLGICAWYVFSVMSVFRGKERVLKTSLSAYVFVLFCLVLVFILQKTGFFFVLRDEKLLQEYLQKAGVWMPLLYILLQFLQVVVLPIPSIVSTLAGLALFGAVKTLLYSFVGIALGSFFAFWIGRKLGNRAVAWMVGEETLRKWQKKLKGKDRLFLTLMFLLPLFPDDILCFLAGLSTMGWGYFTFVILLSRALALSTTCFSVDFIPFTTWWGGLFWVLFAIILIVIFVFIYKNLDKIQQKIDRIKAKIRKKR